MQPATAAGSRTEIKNARRTWKRVAEPDWTRRFIHGESRGCKVRTNHGTHHRPSRRRGDEATRGSEGGSHRAEIQGNLKIKAVAALNGRRRGAKPAQARTAAPQATRKSRGNPEVRDACETSGKRSRREPGKSPLANRKVETPGQPGRNASRAEGFGKRGNPEERIVGDTEGQGCGATRAGPVGTAER